MRPRIFGITLKLSRVKSDFKQCLSLLTLDYVSLHEYPQRHFKKISVRVTDALSSWLLGYVLHEPVLITIHELVHKCWMFIAYHQKWDF